MFVKKDLIKTNLIEKLIPLILKQKFPLEQKIDFQKDINDNSRNIQISINYYISPLSISKKNIDNNSLFLVFNDASNIDIYFNENKFTNILLFKNSGISIPKDTVINSKFNSLGVGFLRFNGIGYLGIDILRLNFMKNDSVKIDEKWETWTDTTGSRDRLNENILERSDKWKNIILSPTGFLITIGLYF